MNPHIFDNATQLKLNILTAISKKTQWYSAERLASLTNSEKKTILKYTNELITDSKNFNHDELTIRTKKSKGIFLQCTDKRALAGFRLFIIESTFTIQLMKRLFFNLDCSLTFLSQKYYLSESTIRRKISILNTTIKSLGVKIVARNKNFSLVGKESQIRMLAYISFWTVYKDNIWPFPIIDETKINQLTAQLLEQLGISQKRINLIDQQMLRYILAINMVRFHQGNEVQATERWAPYLSIQTFTFLEQKLATDSYLSKNEVKFFFLVIQTFTKPYEFQEIKESLINEHQKLKTPAYQLTEAFFTSFQQEFACTFSYEQKNELFGFLVSSHLFCELFYCFSVGVSGYSNFETMQQNYPNLVKKMDHLIEELDQKNLLSLLPQRKFLQTIYGLIYSSIRPMTLYERSLIIYLESDLPQLAEKLVIKDIQLTFQNKFNLQFFTDDSLIPENHCDLILSTSTLPILEQTNTESPILYINTTLTSQDYSNIYRHLNSLGN